MLHRGTSVLLALVFLVIGCAAETTVPPAQSNAQPIVGGEPATGEELHSTVSILWNIPPVRYNWVRCGGSLIFRRVVLTAAHCVTSVDENGDLVVDPPEDFLVAAGYLGSADYPDAERRSVEEVIVHEGFDNFGNLWSSSDPQGMADVYDLALLVLDAPITAVPTIPILPADAAELALVDGTPAAILGYGQTDTGTVGNLYAGESTIERFTATELVTRVEPEQGDTCFGDSGSPLYIDYEGGRYIVGVTSRGRSDATAECGDGGIYTLAPEFFPWIMANLSPEQVFACSASPHAASSSGALWFVLCGLVWARRQRLQAPTRPSSRAMRSSSGG